MTRASELAEPGDTGDDLDAAALRRQDAGEFTRLVRKHQGLVMGVCQSMGLRSADLDDAAAEAFAAVYRALPGFESRAKLSTWIYSVAIRSVLKFRLKSRSGVNATGGAVPDTIASDDAGPDRRSEDAEMHERLWAAVAALEPRMAAAVELFYRRGWPVEKVADVLECPQGTIKTLLFRAREKLRDVLSRQEIG